MVLTNKTKYAARNPGLRIQFDGLLFNGIPPEWTSVERWGEWNGLKAIQWDGGIENIIHGKWSRTLPIVGFNEIAVISDSPTLIITVVADGCPPEEFRFPLDVTILRHVLRSSGCQPLSVFVPHFDWLAPRLSSKCFLILCFPG